MKCIEGIIITTTHATHQAMPHQLLLGMVMRMQMALQLGERQRHGRRGNHALGPQPCTDSHFPTLTTHMTFGKTTTEINADSKVPCSNDL